jgi:hypothetical protein
MMEHKDVILRANLEEKLFDSIETIADSERTKSEMDIKLMEGVFKKRIDKTKTALERLKSR